MKMKIIALVAIIAVFGLALIAYAQTTSVQSERSCCVKDSGPLKKGEDHKSRYNAKGEHKCCGESCPMKGGDHKSGDHAKMESHDCCGDSCPMKKKNGEAKAVSVSASEEGKDCRDNCDCCNGKADTATA